MDRLVSFLDLVWGNLVCLQFNDAHKNQHSVPHHAPTLLRSRLNPCMRLFVCCSGMSCVHRSSATDKWAVDRPADRPAEKGAEAMVTAMWS